MDNSTFDPNKVYDENTEEEGYKKKPLIDFEQLFSIRSLCNICFFIMLALLGYSFVGDVVFKARHMFPKFSYVEINPVDTTQNPKQTFLPESEQKLLKGQNDYTKFAYKPIAEYSISGMLVAINTDFWLRGIMRTDFDKISLMDVGIVWGDVANKQFIKDYMTFKSQKSATARTLWYRYKCSGNYCQSFSYIKSHVAHTHLVPANDNIMGALLKMKKYDTVKLDGYLSDIYFPKGGHAITSTSRSDNNATSRGAGNGGGACEIMYVTKVQLSDKVYK